MNRMTALRVEISRDNNNNNHSNHNKRDIIPVTKAVARRSTLMQTTKAKAANGSH
jgi:hypothetical protein